METNAADTPYKELAEERVASAVAADEAMTMINGPQVEASHDREAVHRLGERIVALNIL